MGKKSIESFQAIRHINPEMKEIIDELWNSLITIYEDENFFIKDQYQCKGKIHDLIVSSLRTINEKNKMENIIKEQASEIDAFENSMKNISLRMKQEMKNLKDSFILSEVIVPFIKQIKDKAIVDNQMNRESFNDENVSILHESVLEIQKLQNDVYQQLEDQKIQIDELIEQKNILESSNRNLCQNINKYEAKIKSNEEEHCHKLSILENENQILQSNIKQVIEDENEKYIQIQQKFENSQQIIVKLNNDKDSLNTLNAEHLQCIVEGEKKLENLSIEINKNKSIIYELENKISNQKNENINLEKDKSKMLEDIENLKIEMEAANSQHFDLITKKENEIIDISKEKENLERDQMIFLNLLSDKLGCDMLCDNVSVSERNINSIKEKILQKIRDIISNYNNDDINFISVDEHKKIILKLENDFIDLSNNKRIIENDFEKLKQDNTYHIKELEKQLENEVNKLKTIEDSYLVKKTHFEQIISLKDEKIDCLKEMIEDYKQKLDKSTIECTELSTSKEDLNAQLNDQLKFINEEYLNLQTEMNTLKLEKDSEIVRLQEEISKLLDNLKNAKENSIDPTKIDQLKNQIFELEEEKNDMMKLIESAGEEIESLKGQISGSKIEIEKLEKIIENYSLQLEEEKQSKAALLESEQLIISKSEKLKIESESLRIKNIELNRIFEETTAENSKILKLKDEEIIKTKRDMSKNIENLKNEINILKVSKNDLLENIEKEKSDKNKIELQLSADLEQLRSDYEQQKCQFDTELEKYHKEKKHIKDKLDDCETIIVSLKDQNEIIKSEFNEINHRYLEITEKMTLLMDKCKNLENQLSERNNQIVDQAEELAELRSIKNDNDKLNQQYESIELNCKLITEDKERLEDKISRLKAAYKQKCELLKTKQMDIDELQPSINQMATQIKELQSLLDEKKEVIRIKEKEFLHLQKNYHAAKEKILKLKNKRSSIDDIKLKHRKYADKSKADDLEDFEVYIPEKSLNKISFHKTPERGLLNKKRHDHMIEDNTDFMTENAISNTKMSTVSNNSHKKIKGSRFQNFHQKISSEMQNNDEKENIGGDILDRISFLAKQSSEKEYDKGESYQTPKKSIKKMFLSTKSPGNLVEKPFVLDDNDNNYQNNVMHTPRLIKRSKSIINPNPSQDKKPIQDTTDSNIKYENDVENKPEEEKKERSCITH